jgi:glycerol-3-phosphate acyltransferase PlsY
MLELSVKFLISYFIGSIVGSMLVGRLSGGIDIRNLGSGNAGGTNALRTQGLGFALAVVVIDVGKGVVAAGIVPGLGLWLVPADAEISRIWLTLCCSAAAVIGHVWPMWHDFRGGKGAATLVGTLIVLAPATILPILIVWASTLVMFGYVGLATVSAGIAAPVYLAVTRLPEDQPVFIYCVVLALYLLFSHRSNIERMWRGNESRFSRAMIFRKGR